MHKQMYINNKSSIYNNKNNNTGRFITLFVITNIYNKKIKGPNLMEFFTATGKLKKFFFTTRNVRCMPCHTWCTHRTSLVVKKNFFTFSRSCEKIHYGRSFGFLVINVCNHGEHYETPYIFNCKWVEICRLVHVYWWYVIIFLNFVHLVGNMNDFTFLI